MKVGLLQVKLESGRRSANLQRVLSAICSASKHRPAPDLLVLGGGCDTGGATPTASCSRAAMKGIRESIAAEARAWGICIACGLHHWNGSRWRPHSVLFDANGDEIAETGIADESPSDLPHTEPPPGQPCSGGFATAPSPIGRVILSDSVEQARSLPSSTLRGAFVAVPLPAAGQTASGAQAAVEELIAEGVQPGGPYWGLVGGGSGEKPCFACVVGLAASPGTCSGGANEAVMVVDVPNDGPSEMLTACSIRRVDQAD